MTLPTLPFCKFLDADDFNKRVSFHSSTSKVSCATLATFGTEIWNKAFGAIGIELFIAMNAVAYEFAVLGRLKFEQSALFIATFPCTSFLGPIGIWIVFSE